MTAPLLSPQVVTLEMMHVALAMAPAHHISSDFYVLDRFQERVARGELDDDALLFYVALVEHNDYQHIAIAAAAFQARVRENPTLKKRVRLRGGERGLDYLLMYSPQELELRARRRSDRLKYLAEYMRLIPGLLDNVLGYVKGLPDMFSIEESNPNNDRINDLMEKLRQRMSDCCFA